MTGFDGVDWNTWPAAVTEALARQHDPPTSIERLSGMSLSGVWRIQFAARSLIVKAGTTPAESDFYEQVAPDLRRLGIPIPDLELAIQTPDSWWLVIEDIPDPLPIATGDSWKPDPRIIAILARLHAITRANPPDLPSSPERGWSDAMTQSALASVPDLELPILNHLQAESVALAEPWCWISGDPNPRNWGQRADGTPVLFDWELFGPDRPATDLAIIVPGLGDPAAYTRAASAYQTAWPSAEPLPWGTANLAHQIAIAKVTTVVQLLHSHATGNAHVSDDLLDWLRATAPAWFEAVYDFVTAGRS